MVLEYCDEGSLKSYLLRQRSRAGMQRRTSPELIDRMPQFCYEIASAMDFLHRRNVSRLFVYLAIDFLHYRVIGASITC